MDSAARRRISEPLLSWYVTARRDLPFRRTRDPYAIWVSEVMLQQTQVSTMLPYYEQWMRRFPDVAALARAKEQEVLHAFQGLGYYSRARSLLNASRDVVGRFGGEMPRSAEALRSLPGIGAYTAGAIASIAYGERTPVVDGNVVRVLCRLFVLRGDPGKPPLKNELWKLAAELIPPARPGDFNQALMELGATVCKPRSPSCEECPLARRCRAKLEGKAQQFPEIPERPKPTHVRMAAAVVFHRSRVAILQLPANAPRWAGMWQFPSVELMPEESEAQGAARAARESLGVSVRVEAPLSIIQHSVTRYRIHLAAYRCVSESSTRRAPTPVFRKIADLESLAMPAAHRRLARQIAAGAPQSLKVR